MTIRYTCPECSSVLKIKDELAGTAGKCPKCKTKFVVPSASDNEQPKSNESLSDREPGASATPPTSESNESPPTPKSDSSSDLDQPLISPSASSAELSDTIGFQSPDQGTETLALPEDPAPVDEPSQAPLSGPVELALPDDDSPPPIVKSAPTAEFSKPVTNFDQPLRLDDSDDDLDALPPVTLQKKAPSTSDLDVFSDDDDDSPSFMVGSVSPGTKPKTTSDEARESEPPKTAEKKPKSSKSSAEMAPFDPLKYLMDSPAQNSDTFSTGPESDADLSLDDLDHKEDAFGRQTPASKPKSSASIPSRATPEKVDLATAARMMKKAIKESQADAAHQRELDAEAGFDYGQFFREFGIRGVGVLVGGLFGIFACYFLSSYFWGSAVILPKLGYVTGVVKLDGKPLAGAIVYYAPDQPDDGAKKEADGTKKIRARTSMGLTDDQGRFTMMYLPERRIQGVALGKCRIWVEHMGSSGNDIPRAWMQNAMRPVLVKAGSQVEDISMDSDPDPKKKK